MADGLAEGLWHELATSVEHLEHMVARVIRDMFGHGGSSSSVDAVRWEGMSNAQLAAAVRQLNSGPGTSGIRQAADALSSISNDLQTLDNTLHQQLQAIGVNWQSEASELAQEMTTEAAAYSSTASGASGAASAAVNAQADAFTAAKNAVPSPSELTGNTGGAPGQQQQPGGASFLSTAGAILTGHNEDHSQTVANGNAARQQTIDALNTYTSNSTSGLAAHQPLPQPPPITATPVSVSAGGGGGGSQVTAVSGYVPPAPAPAGGQTTAPSGWTGGAPSGGGTGAGGLSGLPTVGQPVASGLPGGASAGVPSDGSPTGFPGVGEPGLPGGGVPSTGFPGTSFPGAPAAGVPGSGVPGSGALGGGAAGGGAAGGGAAGGGAAGGGLPGVGAGTPGGGLPGGGATGSPTGGVAGRLGPGPVSGIGATAGPGAGGASSAAAAASGAVSNAIVEDAAVGSAIVGGTVGAGVGGATARKDELVRTRDLVPEDPDDEGTDARSQAARALAELEGEEAAEAGVSARIGATAELPPTLLEPAVTGRDDEDERHSNRYGMSDEEMFGDGRMVVPPVLDGSDQASRDHGDFGPRGSK